MLRELLHFLAMLPLLWLIAKYLPKGNLDVLILILSLFYFFFIGFKENEPAKLTEGQRSFLARLPATHSELKQEFPVSTLNKYIEELNDLGLIWRDRWRVWRLTPKGAMYLYNSPLRRLTFQFKAFLERILL